MTHKEGLERVTEELKALDNSRSRKHVPSLKHNRRARRVLSLQKWRRDRIFDETLGKIGRTRRCVQHAVHLNLKVLVRPLTQLYLKFRGVLGSEQKLMQL